MNRSRYQTGFNGPTVDARFAIVLGDNKESGDRTQYLMAAPSINGPGYAIIYLTGNGDPTYLLTLDANGDTYHQNDEIQLNECLELFDVFVGEDDKEIVDHLESIFNSMTEREGSHQ